MELVDEVHGTLIPAGREPRDVDLVAEAVYLAVLLKPEFEPALEVPVSRAEGILTRLGQLLGGVYHVDRAFLELHGIAPGSVGHLDQHLGQLYVAVVVDADLRDDIAGVPISNER